MEYSTLTKALNKKEDLNREQHITLMLYKLWIDQGENKSIRVNSEDIAYAAFENWPSRYSWNLKKYSHLPDLDKVRRALEHSRKSKLMYGHKDNKNLVNDGYTLTEQGLKFGKQYVHLLEDEEIQKAPNKQNIYIKNYLSRIKSNTFYKSFLNGNKDALINEISIHHIAEILETTVSNMTRFNEKFINTKKYALTYEDDENLINFLRFLEELFEEIDMNLVLENNLKKAKSKKGFEKGIL